MSDQTSEREDDSKQGSLPEDQDSAGQAKDREREMEESGEENAA